MPDNVINKVVFEGRTLVDLTDTTATAETILSGYGAYGADGVWVDGTATAGSLSGHVWQDNEGYIHLDDDGGDMYITTPLNVTTNGTYTAPTGVAYTPVSVTVVPTLQSKTVSPTETQQIIIPDGTSTTLATLSPVAGDSSKRYTATVDLSSLQVGDTVVVSGGLQTLDGTSYPISSSKRDVSHVFTWTGESYTYKVYWENDSYVYYNITISTTQVAVSIASYTGAYDGFNATQMLTISKMSLSYDGLSQVSVGAIASDYVGSGVTRRSSSDMIVNGASVAAPAGYYSSISSKSVASGTEGTPIATKGTVSNHAVTVTPSVTNTTGYITGSTKTGTGVQVTASELASGNKEITENGDNIDVVGYSTVSVNVGGGSTPHTAYIIRNSSDTRPSVQYGSTIYRTDGDTFTFDAGDTLVCYLSGEMADGSLLVDGVNVSGGSVTYRYTLPDSDITINLNDVASGTIRLTTLTSDFGKVDEKQINFITYDGTILYSYTATEWANVTSLPSSPYYENLLSEGWNWTKPLIDAQLSAIPNGVIWVGQIFMPLSRCTELDVEMISPRLSPSMNISVNGTAIIDWGDNTTPDTITGTSLTTNLAPTHTYASGGRYTIKIRTGTTATKFQFYGSSSITLLYKSGANVNQGLVYSNCIKAIRIGIGFNGVSAYSFAYCLSLEYITFPYGTYGTASHVCDQCTSLKSYTSLSGIIFESSFNICYSLKNISTSYYVTQFATNSIRGCYSLRSVTVSKYCTSLMSAAFQNCNALAKIALPEGITTINASAFDGCKSLASITIPSTVTSIGNYAFMNCYGLAEIHALPTTPPTLGSSVLSGSTADVVIYVPYSNDHSILEAYQTAWSTYASYIVEEAAP